MDPYLEMHWEDVHTRLIGYFADAIQPQLADDLIARMEEKVYVEDAGEIRLRKPDVRIVEMPGLSRGDFAGGGAAVLEEPMLLEPIGDPIRHRSVLIYDSAGQRIITAIELLGPWNKSPGKATQAYMEKREKYLDSEINLVEIDLIRTGDWTDMIGFFSIPGPARTTYRVTVSTPEARGPLHYPIPLRAKLPTIKVPLRPQDSAVLLNLQELVQKAYLMGRYDRIDYTKPCKPPLEGPDQEWAAGLIPTWANDA